MEQEDAHLAALETADTYKIEGANMGMRTGEGSKVAGFGGGMLHSQTECGTIRPWTKVDGDWISAVPRTRTWLEYHQEPDKHHHNGFQANDSE
jgi:hypothetical protein